LLSLFALPVRADGPGTFEGKVTNSSKGGEAVAGLEVNLHPSDGGSDRKATSDSEGIFRFDGLATTDAISYTVSLSYGGVYYENPAIAFGAGENAKKIEVPVYETGEDSSAIQADIAHIILDIDPSQNTIGVTEFQALSNSSDKVYVGKLSRDTGQREILRFPVPDGAVHLQSLDDVGGVSVTPLPNGGGFADTTPFLPGTREVAYFYMLDYGDSSFVLQRPTSYNTGRINILITDVGAKVSAPGFIGQQPVEVEGNRYLVLSAAGLAQGQNVQLQLSGLPLAGGAAQGVTDNLRLGAVILVPLAMAVVMVFFLRSRRAPMRPVPADPLAGDEKVQLVRLLVELDDRFERGHVPEPEYTRLRADIKRKLADLWLRPDVLSQEDMNEHKPGIYAEKINYGATWMAVSCSNSGRHLRRAGMGAARC
ncbi:MAG: carboxypeptidase-like regulatory domain-containing protein, partial [Dehalococcoidia bacterium]|nr:carboxypeptidase-like regulatory domain-containing protein [Dehalococcoidia bacterium]